MNTTNPDIDRLAVRSLAKLLAHAALDVGDHSIALQALLLAYSSVAAAHPCCTARAADAAEAAAKSLRSGELQAPHASPHVH